MKNLILTVALVSAVVACGAPPEDPDYSYIELRETPGLNGAAFDSVIRSVERDEKLHSVTASRELPVLRYKDNRVRALIDSIILVEKTKEFYGPNIQFALSFSVGGEYPQYMVGKDVIGISAMEHIYYDKVLGTIKGAIRQQDHIVVVRSRNDALFKKLIEKTDSVIDVEMRNSIYKDMRTGKIRHDDFLFDDRFRSWKILYEYGKMTVLSNNYWDYHNSPKK